MRHYRTVGSKTGRGSSSHEVAIKVQEEDTDMEDNVLICNRCNKKDTCNLKSDNVKECENFNETKPESFKCYKCGKILIKGKDAMRYIGKDMYKCGTQKCDGKIIQGALKREGVTKKWVFRN